MTTENAPSQSELPSRLGTQNASVCSCQETTVLGISHGGSSVQGIAYAETGEARKPDRRWGSDLGLSKSRKLPIPPGTQGGQWCYQNPEAGTCREGRTMAGDAIRGDAAPKHPQNGRERRRQRNILAPPSFPLSTLHPCSHW